MRVTILDVDWYNHNSFVPNPTCMRLSSYYKQLGYNVNFILSQFDLDLAYDKICLVRENTLGTIPEGINLLCNNVELYGKGFRFFKNYHKIVGDVVLSCRPDYSLYPLQEKNKYVNANFIAFFDSHGELLTKRQDYRNTYEKTKDLVITDTHFWEHDYNDLKRCVRSIRGTTHIMFQEPISLKYLLNNEEKQLLFFSLQYDREVTTSFTYDCDVEDNERVFMFLMEWMCYSPLSTIPIPVFKMQYTDNDFENIMICFDLAERAKRNGVRIKFKAPPRNTCALFSYYEDLESWTVNNFHLSYVEYLGKIEGNRRHMDYQQVLLDRMRWTSVITQNFGDLCRKDIARVEQYCFAKWLAEDSIHIDLRGILHIEENKNEH